jgi:cytochrome c-type biogenesis protein CcmH
MTRGGSKHGHYHEGLQCHERVQCRERAALQGRVSRLKFVWASAPTVRRMLHGLILTAAVLLLMGASDDSARFKDLGHRMMCVCGCNQILLECNHVGCTYSDKMRDQLQAALDKGNNDDLTLQGFVQEYGPTVIAAPTATGFNRVAWIMPFAVLALGITFVIYVVRSWKNRPTPALADGIAIAPASELEEFRRKARKETDQ